MKAKNENSLMCAYMRAREENRGEVLPKQDLFSSIVLVFRAEQVGFSMKIDLIKGNWVLSEFSSFVVKFFLLI